MSIISGGDDVFMISVSLPMNSSIINSFVLKKRKKEKNFLNDNSENKIFTFLHDDLWIQFVWEYPSMYY